MKIARLRKAGALERIQPMRVGAEKRRNKRTPVIACNVPVNEIGRPHEGPAADVV